MFMRYVKVWLTLASCFRKHSAKQVAFWTLDNPQEAKRKSSAAMSMS
jgi:hypothetical protein